MCLLEIETRVKTSDAPKLKLSSDFRHRMLELKEYFVHPYTLWHYIDAGIVVQSHLSVWISLCESRKEGARAWSTLNAILFPIISSDDI